MKIIKLVMAMALLCTVMSIILLAQAGDSKAQVNLKVEVVPPAAPCSIGDTVFYDYNGNGMQDGGEGGISGITLNLYVDDGDGEFNPSGGTDDLVGSASTNASGYYEFTDLDPTETYWVDVVDGTLPAGLTLTAGNDPYGPISFEPEAEVQVLARDDADFGYRPTRLPPRGVGGEAYPVNKLAILTPWIALAAAIIAGATIVMRRRGAEG